MTTSQPGDTASLDQSPRKPPLGKGPLAVIALAVVGAVAAISYGAGLSIGRGHTVAESVPAPVTATVTRTIVASAPTATTPASTARTSFSDGQYLVGSEIEPGRYRTSGGGSVGMCAWAAYSGGVRDLNHPADGASSTGQMYLTAKTGQLVETAGGCTWTRQP